MNNCFFVLFLIALGRVHSQECNINCPEEDGEMKCGFNLKANTYTMFPSKCAMIAYVQCYNVVLAETKLKYCIKGQNATRRMEEESCPVFCPNHYRPVCGASKIKFYMYRTFTNGCYLDMLNCRGEDDSSAYIEVPLEFCQNHAMKNIFKEQVVVSYSRDYNDY